MKAYGPGLKKDGVLPGKPANFTVDSTKTGQAPITVDVTGKTTDALILFFIINQASHVKLSLYLNEKSINI